MIPSDDHPPLDLLNSQKFHDFNISCDEKVLASVCDIDLVADLDASNNSQSSFSIRDYVFNSRSRNIACNWPFSPKTLQICLQHEVKNILPPFQSLESIRNNPSNQEIISSCDGKSNLELTLESKKSKNSQTNSQQSLGQTKSKKPVMASKICPVCKIFSSSSNTTLNAHIDQCLSGESPMNWSANPEVVIKHRIKPRKMRLMVDIYKTAPHCTVEELDARNGISWANNSTFPDQEIEFHGKQEKEEHAATTIVDHDVCSDNNRTKVRILSVPLEDNDASNDGYQKKGGKSGKVFLWKKKNKDHEHKHDQKYLKQSPNSKKSSIEVTADPEETVGSRESRNKEAMNKDDLPIVRPPWACSKRTGLAKKNSTAASDRSFSKSGFKPASSLSNNSRKMGSLTPNKVQFAKKRSLLLTKPSFKHLKKRDTVSHNSCKDPADSFLVKGSDLRSKGISRNTASCESMNILEVKKNEKLEICRPENSVSSRSLNEDSSWLNIESIRNENRSNKEQVSTMQVPKSSDNMFDSRERDIDVTDNIDMSDSPISTVSNPSLVRSDCNKFSVRSTPRENDKYALVDLTRSGDWRSKGQSQTTDNQPCCCSRKEIASTFHDQSTLLRKYDVESLPPPVKLPVIRLMGKNLTVVNTDEEKVNRGQFSNVQNRYSFSSFTYQNGFNSQQHSTLHLPNSLKNHALDTLLQSTMIPANHNRKNSLAFNNGSFQACSPFMNKISMGR